MRYLFRGNVAVPFALAVLAVTGFPDLVAAADIDTLTGWNGSAEVHNFGATPNFSTTETYGQVITPDASQKTLNSFIFSLRPNTDVTWQMRPYVFLWNGNRATGSALFTGSATTLVGDNTFHTVTTNVGSLALTSGQQYVLFLSVAASQDYDASTPFGGGGWAVRTTDPYGGGTFVFQNSIASNADVTNGAGYANLTGQDWSKQTGSDLAFQAHFSGATVAPEASSLVLYSLPLLGFLIHRRYKRTR